MNFIRILLSIIVISITYGCGKVGPLTLPENKLDKSIITYPCDEECQKKFEEEKNRQQSVILQTE
tara:strand:- start:555 stop:749 length:195 start_codon:yes stop_codon:yes gene_type:complete